VKCRKKVPGRKKILLSREKRVSENCIRFYAKLRMDDISFLMNGWMDGWMMSLLSTSRILFFILFYLFFLGM
jgi:hypothetical protein